MTEKLFVRIDKCIAGLKIVKDNLLGPILEPIKRGTPGNPVVLNEEIVIDSFDYIGSEIYKGNYGFNCFAHTMEESFFDFTLIKRIYDGSNHLISEVKLARYTAGGENTPRADSDPDFPNAFIITSLGYVHVFNDTATHNCVLDPCQVTDKLYVTTNRDEDAWKLAGDVFSGYIPAQLALGSGDCSMEVRKDISGFLHPGSNRISIFCSQSGIHNGRVDTNISEGKTWFLVFIGDSNYNINFDGNCTTIFLVLDLYVNA